MRASSRARPERVPFWQLWSCGGQQRGARRRLPAPADVALARPARHLRPVPHVTSVAGDALLAVALADSVFFSIPVGQAKIRVAAYLALTMLPLALAGPLLVPLLDRAGPRRAISFGAAAGRAAVAIYAAPRFGTLLLFPAALRDPGAVEGARDHEERAHRRPTRRREEGLMRANARLGPDRGGGAVAGAAPFGIACS